MRRVLLIVAAALLAGCSGGGGYQAPTDPAPAPAPGPGPAPIPPGSGTLNLTTGVFTPTTTPGTTGAGPVFFRRFTATGQVNQNDAIDETGGSTTSIETSVGPVLLAATELSRAQWRALADTTPWANIDPAELAGPADNGSQYDTLAAAGLSLADIDAALNSWNALHPPVRLRLPTPAEWEVACRGGQSAPYAWGSSTTAFSDYARVKESRGTSTGPEAVSPPGRVANALGFTSMHGNVWEWVQNLDGTDPHLRGGSWHDEWVRSNSGNRLQMPRSVRYATAGVRLVLELP